MEDESYSLLDHIERLEKALLDYEPHTKEYQQLVARLGELIAMQLKIEEHIMKTDVEDISWTEKILSNGPLVSGVLTVVGIIWVTKHENVNVITSRAFGFLRFK